MDHSHLLLVNEGGNVFLKNKRQELNVEGLELHLFTNHSEDGQVQRALSWSVQLEFLLLAKDPVQSIGVDLVSNRSEVILVI